VCFAGCAAVAVANTRARESVIALSQGANKTYSIVSESMAPDIPRGALVAATDVGTPKRGDVVVVSTASLPGVDASEVAQIVKRVVGLPGERIEGRDGSVYVNGEPLAEPYASGRTEFGSQAVTLGPDEYFVLGDNRANSKDSRFFGPVPRSALKGRVIRILAPPSKAGAVPGSR
jgi:signal peptidase I